MTVPAVSDRAQAGAAQPPWRALLGYIRPHRTSLVLGAVLSVATTATGLALPLVVRELVSSLSRDRSIAPLLAAMMLLVLANAVIGALGGYVLRRAAESVVLSARTHLIGRLLRLRLTAVEQSEPGDLMSRVTSDTTLLSEVATESLVGGATGAIALAATLVMMTVLDPVLVAVTVVALGTAVVVIGLVVPRIRRAARRAQESVGDMGASLERVFGAFRTMKASNAERREQVRVESAARDTWRASIESALWSAVAGNTAGLAIQLAFVAVLTVGGARVASGAISVGTLVAFLLYIYYLMPAVQSVTSAVSQYQYGAAAIRRIQGVDELPTEGEAPVADDPSRGTPEVLNAERSETRQTGATRVLEQAASVSFDRVWFRYADELTWVLQDLSFDIPPLGMTALVGPSGAGKTTTFSLIERFYDPVAGRVLVDGRDVLAWPLAALRAAIGYVEQDAPVLSGTLRENLVYGAPDVTDEELDEVLGTTRLSSFVASLPQRLETPVGHRGMKLSGGERQRIAIARALLRRPRVLLLDEATSQLDALNEAALRDTIAAISEFTTVLVVAHRLSTITLADRILVLDAGLLRAAGTHQELLTGDALYAELAATQFLTAVEDPT